MLKIAVASSSLPPMLGISVYVDETNKCLYRQGHEVMVFAIGTYLEGRLNYAV